MNEAEASVLFANESFYAAFHARDMAAMRALWAERAPVCCIHPGWNALDGREAVLGSWASIMGNPQSPRIHCLAARAYLYGDAALVVCYEVLEGGVLVATNGFVREDGRWRMVHHQAGPASELPPEAAPQASDQLH
jgi:ketosteroid isomerase-like protein